MLKKYKYTGRFLTSQDEHISNKDVVNFIGTVSAIFIFAFLVNLI